MQEKVDFYMFLILLLQLHGRYFKPFVLIFLQTRLGPKPFSNESAEVSFDKVFAVPIPPSNDREKNNLVNEDDRELLKMDQQIVVQQPAANDDVSFLFVKTKFDSHGKHF
jgi:hypothetical protein